MKALLVAAVLFGFPKTGCVTVDANVQRVIDGDTYDVVARVWMGEYRSARLRLLGVDTPEIRGPEKPIGLAVAAIVAGLIEHKNVKIIVCGKDSFGRWLADVKTEEVGDLADYLLEQNLAEPYKKRNRRQR